jgi:hypothetical protein
MGTCAAVVSSPTRWSISINKYKMSARAIEDLTYCQLGLPRASGTSSDLRGQLADQLHQ